MSTKDMGDPQQPRIALKRMSARWFSSTRGPTLRSWSVATLLSAPVTGTPAEPVPTAAPAATRPEPLTSMEYKRLLQRGQYVGLDKRLSASQAAYERGAIDDEQLRLAFLVAYDTDPSLAPHYEKWVARLPKSYTAHLARGIYLVKVAEAARGVQSIDQTKDQQFAAMEDALGKASDELSASLPLTKKPLLTYARQLSISRLTGDAQASRQLLDRALAIDPNTYVVRAVYMGAIETRWGGSHELLLSFLEECRHSKLAPAQLRHLESVVADDAGWIAQYVDHDYPAAEAAYRKSAALGGDKQLANLAAVLDLQQKFKEELVPLTEEIEAGPSNPLTFEYRALAYTQLGKMKEAVADWKSAADLGSVDAQNRMGIFSMTGVPGVITADPKTGIAWFRKAANQGDPNAKHNLDQALAANPTLK